MGGAFEAEAGEAERDVGGRENAASAEEPRSRGSAVDLEGRDQPRHAGKASETADRGQQRQDPEQASKKGPPWKASTSQHKKNDRMGQGGTEMKQKIQKKQKDEDDSNQSGLRRWGKG